MPHKSSDLEYILIADDKVERLEEAKKSFEEHGYNFGNNYSVQTYRNGEGLIEFYRGHIDNVGLVLSDYQMERQTGLDVVRQIISINKAIAEPSGRGRSDSLTAWMHLDSDVESVRTEPKEPQNNVYLMTSDKKAAQSEVRTEFGGSVADCVFDKNREDFYGHIIDRAVSDGLLRDVSSQRK